MILEAAYLIVKPGKEIQFEKDFVDAGQYIESIKGYIKHSLSRCLEQEKSIIG